MTYSIREIRACEAGILEDFLYEAIFVPEGEMPPPREIIARPELQVYIAGFGTQKDDAAFVAQAGDEIVGAVWVRDMDDYGHVEEGVPSFALSVKKPYRGCGIGTALMKAMLDHLRNAGYEKASLAVQKANYAARMYRRLGFETVDENEQEYIMVCRLQPGGQKAGGAYDHQ